MFQLISSETHIIWFLLNEVIKSYCRLVKDQFILVWSLVEKKKQLQSKGAAGQTLGYKAELTGHRRESSRGAREGGPEGCGADPALGACLSRSPAMAAVPAHRFLLPKRRQRGLGCC